MSRPLHLLVAFLLSSSTAFGTPPPRELDVALRDAALTLRDPVSTLRDPGVTLRIHRIAQELTSLPELAPDQTPAADQLRPVVDFRGDYGFLDIPSPIYTTVTGWIDAPSAGEYRFRLVSDDGSRMFLEGALLIDNDGRHGERARDSAPLMLEAGSHPFLIEHFDHAGRRVLRLEWIPPAGARESRQERGADEISPATEPSSDFVLVSTSALWTERDLTRVTAPGFSRLIDGLRPGDGLPVPGVHPSWDLSTIRPEGFEPMVGAMTFLPDGRLVVGTFDPLQRDERELPDIESKTPDRLYALRNVQSGDREKITVDVIADGLFEPAGLCVVDGELYVSHRREITRLRDLDGDGFLETHEPVASGWDAWNYHQFTRGLVHHDGVLFATLTTVMAPPAWEGMETNAGPNGPLRGTIIAVELETGDGPATFPSRRTADVPVGEFVPERGSHDQARARAPAVRVDEGVHDPHGPATPPSRRTADAPLGEFVPERASHDQARARAPAVRVDEGVHGPRGPATPPSRRTADVPVGEFVPERGSHDQARARAPAVRVDEGVHGPRGRGRVRAIAGGLRTPNGIGMIPAVSPGAAPILLCTDNQGAWMPMSQLCEMIPGRFYGHYNWTRLVPKLADRFPPGGHPSAFSDRPRTPASLLLPQNEAMNSPTDPVAIPEGPFAGQVFIGELTAGGIRRAFLERVHGQLQGALFRFTQGLEVGVNSLVLGPDGALYIGGIGAEGNWNWRGTRFGLQRLAPNGRVTFEMHSVSARPNGFLIRFTRPVDPMWLADPTNYRVSQWHIHPTAEYGGPKLGTESLVVRSALPAEDGLSVRVMIDGLKEGSCVHLRTDPTSIDGEEIWSTEAWYTLNAMPHDQADPVDHLNQPRPPLRLGDHVIAFDGSDIDGVGVGVLPPAHAATVIGRSAVDTTRFEGRREATPMLTQDDLINAPEYVEVGFGSGDLVTTTSFGDARIHIEFFCPPGGVGQLAANSGIYLQERYEL